VTLKNVRYSQNLDIPKWNIKLNQLEVTICDLKIKERSRSQIAILKKIGCHKLLLPITKQLEVAF